MRAKASWHCSNSLLKEQSPCSVPGMAQLPKQLHGGKKYFQEASNVWSDMPEDLFAVSLTILSQLSEIPLKSHLGAAKCLGQAPPNPMLWVHKCMFICSEQIYFLAHFSKAGQRLPVRKHKTDMLHMWAARLTGGLLAPLLWLQGYWNMVVFAICGHLPNLFIVVKTSTPEVCTTNLSNQKFV